MPGKGPTDQAAATEVIRHTDRSPAKALTQAGLRRGCGYHPHTHGSSELEYGWTVFFVAEAEDKPPGWCSQLWKPAFPRQREISSVITAMFWTLTKFETFFSFEIISVVKLQKIPKEPEFLGQLLFYQVASSPQPLLVQLQ